MSQALVFLAFIFLQLGILFWSHIKTARFIARASAVFNSEWQTHYCASLDCAERNFRAAKHIIVSEELLSDDEASTAQEQAFADLSAQYPNNQGCSDARYRTYVQSEQKSFWPNWHYRVLRDQ